MEDKRNSKRRDRKNNSLKASQLSNGQRNHLRDFGELHPIDIDESIDDDLSDKKTRFKKKKIERIIDDSLKVKKVKNNIPKLHQKEEKVQQSDEDVDLEEEISPYQKLVSSFDSCHKLTSQQLTKKAKKLHKTSDDVVSNKQKCTTEILATDEEDTELDKSQEERVIAENDDLCLGDSEHGSNSEDEESLSNSKIPFDPFSCHFEIDLEEETIHKVEEWNRSAGKPTKNVLNVGTVLHYPPLSEINDINRITLLDSESSTPEKLRVKPKLCKQWREINCSRGLDGSFTPLQQEIFPTLNSYQDLLYSNRDFDNAEEIREMYCLHALNHILKTRSRILKNNAKIVQAHKESKELAGELRDHGLTRPKVLIMVPFRDAALKIVNVFIRLLSKPGEGQVMNKKRFFDEYSESEAESSGTQNKPDDFKKMFAGNTDDFFRVGMVIMRKAIKLFTEFYSSDIIIASPVGLRSIIGAEGEKNRDYDFLSSIEVLIMDQVDVFLMQNWEHVQHVFEHLHLQPKDSHDVDFSRVRMWNLDGWSKFYRQTLLFGSFVAPEINFIFNKQCFNYCGRTKILPTSLTGSVCQVVVQIPQVFHRVIASSHKEIADKRFEFFINKIFPELKGAAGLTPFTAIFIPSYFDFVRLRNYLKKEEVDFLQLSEYTSRANISRSRSSFLLGTKPLLLFTERFYFYYRYRIRGIKNIVFYQLPRYSHFYSEIVNYMDTSLVKGGSETSATTSTVLYSKFDVQQLSGVVGSRRCEQMLTSEQTVHMFVTGDQ